MCLSKRVGLATGAAALTLSVAGVTFADPVSPGSDDDLRARLAATEARLAELESNTGENWLTEQRADEIRGLVQDVLADADTRASLLGSGVSAGYDNGFVLGSTDGNWLLRMNGQIQTRYVYNHADRHDPSALDNDENRAGFEVTRAKLIFSGNVVNPDWTYMIEGDMGNSMAERVLLFNGARVQGPDRSAVLDAFEDNLGYEDARFVSSFDSDSLGKLMMQNAWIRYNYGNGWGVKIGQFKSPLLREELVSSGNQLAVERSLLNYVYTAGYTQGIQMEYAGDQWRMMASYNDGANQGSTPWATENTEWAFTGRFEWMLSGNWEQFEDFQSFAGDEQGMLVGGAINYQLDEYGTGLGGGFNSDELTSLTATVDLQWEFGGANLFAAFIYRDLDGDSSAFPDADQYGFLVQGGYMLNDNWEIFARYEWSDYDIDDFEDLSIITAGFNYYFAGNNLKWTTDLLFALESLDISSPITGLRVDDSEPFPPGDRSEDGQFAIRTQVQLLF